MDTLITQTVREFDAGYLTTQEAIGRLLAYGVSIEMARHVIAEP